MAARTLPLTIACALAALVAHAGCGGGATPVTPLDHEALLDPEACKTCHPAAYEEWSGSMHAYASDDPVFRAMNKRAQRENPATGDFCVKCHAPMAVQLSMTTDGMNLDTLPAKMKGVTCYFCHAAESVAGTHNNPLTLSQDDTLFGPFNDPVAVTPHKGVYSRLLDGATLESASMCGSCHDIQNLQGAHVERTFEEWQGTLFSQPPNGQGCGGCHMKSISTGNVSTVADKQRKIHPHGMPGVDLAVTDFPGVDKQRAQAQTMLDALIQPTLCYNPLDQRMELTLENVTAGHSFPSGATPDRRAWIEMTAYKGEDVLFTSGATDAGPLEDSSDPNLWLMRDCLFDGAGQEKKMFWEAVTTSGNAVPGSVLMNVADPTSFGRSHPRKPYPATGMLPMMPDRVTLKIHLQAIGDDVLQDLVQSGDLDASIPPQIARYTLGGAASFEWTPTSASVVNDPNSGALLCVVKPIKYRLQRDVVAGVSNSHCVPPSSATPTQ
jgi:hypothetical protein